MVDHSTEETSDGDNFKSSTTAGHQMVDQSTSFPKPTVTQEIVDLLSHVEKSEELYQSHWIYGVDTGGQTAHFRHCSNFVTISLCQYLYTQIKPKLNDKALFFFSIQGKQIGEPVEKEITNLQLFESLFRLMLLVDLQSY